MYFQFLTRQAETHYIAHYTGDLVVIPS